MKHTAKLRSPSDLPTLRKEARSNRHRAYSTADSGDEPTTRNGGDLRCYLLAGDQVYETYETKWRGIEAILPTLQLLDLTPYGRQETWEDSPAGWPQNKAGSWWRRDGRPVAQWTRTNEAVK